MKRLVILDGYFHWPPGGGGIRDIATVANGLAKEYETILLAPSYRFRGKIGYKKGLDFEVRTIPFDEASFNGPEVLRRFRKSVMGLNPDVVLVGNGNAMKPFLILASRDYRTIVRLYSYELLCPISHGLLFDRRSICESNYIRDGGRCLRCWMRHPQRSAYDRETMRALAVSLPTYHRHLRKSFEVPEAFIVTSRYMSRRYSEIIDPERIVMIPSGLDCTRFAPRESNDHEVVRILSTGRVGDPTKGLDSLIRAAGVLWKATKDFRLIIAGRGVPSNAGEFLKDAGWVSERKLPSLYAASDIVVVPSLWAEPFGMVALEGMGCGKPVVASRTGGLTDFVVHGRNGCLFEPDQVGQLAEILGFLVESPRERKRLGMRARHTALLYDWAQVVPQYARLLDSC